jgi:hypothetical protein
MAWGINSNFQNAVVTAATADLAGGTLRIYTGSKPANANSAPTGTLLAVIDLPTPAFTVSGDTMNMSGTWGTLGEANGTAGWGRFEGTDFVLDGVASAPGGGGDIIVNNGEDQAEIQQNGSVTVSSASFTMPAGG